MPSTQSPDKVRRCARPYCLREVKPGQLACREDWFALSSDLRDRLVYAWEQRKEHPDVPELVAVHRALLLNALKEWGLTDAQIRHFIQFAPRVIPSACPYCGEKVPEHRPGCNRPTDG